MKEEEMNIACKTTSILRIRPDSQHLSDGRVIRQVVVAVVVGAKTKYVSTYVQLGQRRPEADGEGSGVNRRRRLRRRERKVRVSDRS